MGSVVPAQSPRLATSAPPGGLANLRRLARAGSQGAVFPSTSRGLVPQTTSRTTATMPSQVTHTHLAACWPNPRLLGLHCSAHRGATRRPWPRVSPAPAGPGPRRRGAALAGVRGAARTRCDGRRPLGPGTGLAAWVVRLPLLGDYWRHWHGAGCAAATPRSLPLESTGSGAVARGAWLAWRRSRGCPSIDPLPHPLAVPVGALGTTRERGALASSTPHRARATQPAGAIM